MNKEMKEVLQAQLDDEKKLLQELKLVFGQAQSDAVNKIIDLSRRKDMENLQSIIYQKQYQQAIAAQLTSVLEKLHSDEYATISDYLARCYENGYLGAMYDIAGQGIPLIIPIDQEAVVQAIQIDSKLSKPLYDKLGEDITDLKKDVRMAVSRGIANGSSWNDIGEQMSKGMRSTIDMFGFNKARNNSVRIARTEGHRIQNQSAYDAQVSAKKKGADILKQWDSTLDGATREAHRMADGQIRELDEFFDVDGEKLKAPGIGGSASNVINCRCALLQRARWALDEEELDTLKERAEYFELDKSKDFEEFKEKYLKASEQEPINVQKSSKGTSQEKALEKFTKSDKMKNVELPPETTAISGMTKDTEKAISDAFDHIKNQYDVKIDNFVVESLGNGNENVPFQFVPVNVGGFFEAKLVINKDYYFNDSLEEYTKRIARNYERKVLASQSIEDLIAHEMAHIMTFQECETFTQFEELEYEVRTSFIKGMSLYADSTWDGAETIAEAFVRHRRGETIPENVMKLLDRYVLRKAK